MVIISKNNHSGGIRVNSTQFRFGIVYIVVTFVVMAFLNVYCSETSQELFYQSQKVSMRDKTQLVASALGAQDILNEDSVATTVEALDDLKVTRLIVTNASGAVLYDSLSDHPSAGDYYLYPEIVLALQGNDVFTSNYHDGVMESQAAAPILSYSTLSGCVYMMEYDTELGALIQSLQQNILTVSIALEILLLFFSLIFSAVFTKRLGRIMSSIRTIREGDYSHKLHLGGRDELSILGDEFNDLTDRLRESEQRRRQFVSDASHELKTPLASIKLLSDSILQNEMDTQTVREFVADIGDEADRLNRMSYKLLSLTKVDAISEKDCEIVYMAPTIRRVVRMLSAIADNAAVVIRTEIVRDSSILIQEDDLYQIIFNLVENGIKYNVPGGKLTICLDRREDNAVLQIRDTGVGIPEAAIGHIFERFYRVDKARSRRSGGSGLGLAIVHDMVNRNRGTIHVESQVGKNSGTTFTLEFPVFDVEEDTP